MDGLVLLKLTLAPLMVGAVSVVGRRLGPRVAGLLAALPVVAGPTLLFFAWEQGNAFAALAADQTLSGIASLSAYSVAYAWLASTFRHRNRLTIVPVLLLSWAVFGAFTLLFQHLELRGFASLLVSLIGLLLGLALLVEPSASEARASPTASLLGPRLGLLLRMATAAAMVAGLTEAAAWLGPVWSGLLTPFPVASTVLLVAEHAGAGAASAQRLLHGFLTGLFGFAAFCFCLSVSLQPLGIAWGFGFGLLGVVLVQLGLAHGRQRAPRGADAG